VTDVVGPLPLIALAADAGGQVLTGYTTIGNRQPSGTPTVTVTIFTPLQLSLLRHDRADLDRPRRAPYAVAGASGLSGPANRDGRRGRAGVFWRPDGR
jgi:hypothetical protein